MPNSEISRIKTGIINNAKSNPLPVNISTYQVSN